MLSFPLLVHISSYRYAFNLQFWWVDKDPLRGPTTSSDPVSVVDWGGILFMSLRIWHLWGNTIFESRRLIKVISINEIRQLYMLSLNICKHSRNNHLNIVSSFHVCSHKSMWIGKTVLQQILWIPSQHLPFLKSLTTLDVIFISIYHCANQYFYRIV